MWQAVRWAISWILTGVTELHSNSGTPNDTRTLKQRLFHIPESMDEISFTSFLQPYLYVGVLYLEHRPTYFELSSSRNTHWERVPRKRVVWHVHTMNLLSIFHIPKLKWEKWEQGIHIQLSEICAQNPNFLNKGAYYVSSNFGFRGVSGTIFLPSNRKKSNQKTSKNNKEQQPQESRDTQVVTKFISEHSIIDPLNSYISAIRLSSAKIMRFSQ